MDLLNVKLVLRNVKRSCYYILFTEYYDTHTDIHGHTHIHTHTSKQMLHFIIFSSHA